MAEEKLPYEESAHIVTVTGWACKTCSRWWGNDEHMAKWCCAKDLPCECGGRVEKSWTKCGECRAKADLERFIGLSQIDWDGKTPLYSDASDEYFFDEGDLIDVLRDEESTAEDLRLLVCEPQRAPSFCMADHLCDILPDGSDDLPDGAEEAEKALNDYLGQLDAISWTPSNKRLSQKSLDYFNEQAKET